MSSTFPAAPPLLLLLLPLLATGTAAATEAAGAAAVGMGGSSAVTSVAFPYLEAPVGRVEVEAEEWSAFLGDNLERDVGQWRRRGPLHANATLTLFADLFSREPLPAVIKLMLIYKNKIYFPEREDVRNEQPPLPVDPHIIALYTQIQAVLDRGKLTLPDVLFVLNVDDNDRRFCGPKAKCAAPLLSLIKTTDMRGGDTDILIPQFVFSARSLYMYPWSLKKDVAFFRGSSFCSTYWWRRFKECDNPCPRAYMSYRSYVDEKAGEPFSTLDVALIHKLEENITCIPDVPPPKSPVPMGNHSYYRYLLHLEGYSASSRLAQLFHVNSLVLFQQQAFLEYYYRSLKPYVHYVPFWNTTARGIDDIYDVVEEVRRRDAEDPAYVQRIIRAGQSMAIKFLGFSARVRYLRDALTEYKSLFGDMDEFLEVYVNDMRRRGFEM